MDLEKTPSTKLNSTKHNVMYNNLMNTYRNKRVLVTGHTGFKGGWLALWLTTLGAKVVGYSSKPKAKLSLLNAIDLKKSITHVTGDMRDQRKLESLIFKHKPEIVFHLAGRSVINPSYEEPRLTFETNVMGTVNLLEAIHKTRCAKACIFVTSDKCYGDKSITHNYKEEDSLGGSNPYSASKSCAELVIAAYRNSFFDNKSASSKQNASLSSVRAGNVLGGGDWGINRIIPDCVRALSQNKSIIIRKPQSKRPWQYVLEPLSGYLTLGALMYRYGNKYNGAWNFGPDNRNIITVKELTKLTVKHWGGGSYKTLMKSAKHQETMVIRLNTNKAKSHLRWKPIYNISDSVKRTVTWYKHYYNGARGKTLRNLTINEIHEFMNAGSK